MTEGNWNATDRYLPEDNVEVWTMDSGGNVSTLVLQKGLWFFPDFSMYVYYTPMFWKDKQ